MVEDWLANAYEGMSRRQFLARMTAAGVGLAGFAIAANPVAGEVITTPTEGLTVTDSKVASGDFQVPIYEARPAAPGKYPVVLILPEVIRHARAHQGCDPAVCEGRFPVHHL